MVPGKKTKASRSESPLGENKDRNEKPCLRISLNQSHVKYMRVITIQEF